MDQETFPAELYRRMLYSPEYDYEAILTACAVSRQYANWCQEEDFWEEKVRIAFPAYAGSKYLGSWKNTAELLYKGRDIYGPSGSVFHLDGKTTFGDILRVTSVEMENIEYFIEMQPDGSIWINSFYTDDTTIVRRQTYLHSIEFYRQNFLLNIDKILTLST